MQVERFSSSPIGRLHAISVTDRGRRYEHFAYVPAPLPEALALSQVAHRSEEAAAVALGRLDGIATQLPNPGWLSRPAIRQEAVSTSALEGTYSTLPQAFEAEFLETDELDRAEREVRNFIVAAERGYEAIQRNGRPLSLRLIQSLHGTLMEGTGASPGDVGRFRERQNWIGPRRDSTILESYFVPPPPGDLLKEGMFDWEKWIHRDEIPLLVRIAVGHYQFETLHPFIDGNGRMGRLAAQLQLVEHGAMHYPMLNLSPYLERRGDEYREQLREVSASGDFDPWLCFFFEAVRAQSEAAIVGVRKLLDLRAAMVESARASGLRGVGVQILEGLVGFPVITPTRASALYDVSYQAANSAIDRLMSLGFLNEVTGRAYARLFVAPSVIQVLEDNSVEAPDEQAV